MSVKANEILEDAEFWAREINNMNREIDTLREKARLYDEAQSIAENFYVVNGRYRYKVEKTGFGFWPFCVRAGNGTRELFVGHKKACDIVAAELATAFEDGKFVAAPPKPVPQAMAEKESAYINGAISFKNEMLAATTVVFRPHIEGVFAVWAGRQSVPQAMAVPDDLRSKLFAGWPGCSNHGCVVTGPKSGMGTNAICQCMARATHTQLAVLQRNIEMLLSAVSK